MKVILLRSSMFKVIRIIGRRTHSYHNSWKLEYFNFLSKNVQNLVRMNLNTNFLINT